MIQKCPHYGGTIISENKKSAAIKCALCPNGMTDFMHVDLDRGKKLIKQCLGFETAPCIIKTKQKQEEHMNETAIATTSGAEISPEYTEAIQLHRSIMANGQLAAEAFITFCKDLKTMRDKKLYTHLGFEDFESYTEQMAGLKSRQAYNYIKSFEDLGERFLQSNAQLGITKLVALAQISPFDRGEFMEENNVEGLSTRELQAKIDELTKQNEQLSFDLGEREKDYTAKADDERDKQDEIARLSALLKEKDSKISELEARPDIDVAVAESPVDEDKIRAEIEKQLKSEYTVKQKAAIEKAAEKARKEAEQAQAALAETQKQALEREKEIARDRIAALEAENKAIAEKLAAPAKTADYRVKLKFYFEQIKGNFNSSLAAIYEIEDEVEKEKFCAGLEKMLDTMRATVRNEIT